MCRAATNPPELTSDAWPHTPSPALHSFDGPIILPYTANSVMNKWSQIYAAMTDDIK